jgi:hypothetical protein
MVNSNVEQGVFAKDDAVKSTRTPWVSFGYVESENLQCKNQDPISMPKGARNPKLMYGVSLVSNKWVVILTRDKQVFQKSFSHITYGGSGAALAAAQAWRDETARLHPQPLRRDSAQKIRITNKSGVPGVRCRLGPDGKPELWMVQTRVGSLDVRKSFSVGRYGEQAKLLAIAERQNHLDLIEGRATWHPADRVEPDAPPVPPDRWLNKPISKAEVVRRNNRSGIAGVFLRDSGQRVWVARTRSGGKTQYKVFAVDEHGDEGARQMAIVERRKQLLAVGARRR